MDSRRSRVIYQLNLLDEKEGSTKKINYDDSDTETLERFYDKRLMQVINGNSQDTKTEEVMKAEEERNQRMNCYKDIAGLLGLTDILNNYGGQNCEPFWADMESNYPELYELLDLSEVHEFIMELKEIEGTKYTYTTRLFNAMKERTRFTDLLYKHFSTPSKTSTAQNPSPTPHSSSSSSHTSSEKGKATEKGEGNVEFNHLYNTEITGDDIKNFISRLTSTDIYPVEENPYVKLLQSLMK